MILRREQVLRQKKIREDVVKKYLQPCEEGGSLYGKKKEFRETDNLNDPKKPRQQSHMVAYNSFYKKQVNTLFRLLRKG